MKPATPKKKPCFINISVAPTSQRKKNKTFTTQASGSLWWAQEAQTLGWVRGFEGYAYRTFWGGQAHLPLPRKLVSLATKD